MRRIKKVKIVKKPDICIGDHFIYKDIKWICLDIIDGNYLAITAQVWQKLPFDVDCYNDWKESSLRKTLNKEFLSKLVKKHLVIQSTDLIADNGDKAYGTSEDYVTILSCDQYRKYRDLVPHVQAWTLTPWSCSSYRGPFSSDARFVTFYDRKDFAGFGFGLLNTDDKAGVIPVCLFSSKHLEMSRQTRLVEIKKGEKI